MRRHQRVELGVHPLGHGHVAGALGPEHGEGHHRGRAIQPGELARLLEPVGHGGDVGQADLAAVGQHDVGVRQGGDAGRVGEGADGLLLAPHLAAAARQLDVGCAQLGIDLPGGDPQGRHAVRLQVHLDLPGHPADPVHPSHAGHALQLPDHGVVDEPRELLGRHARRRGGERLDRLAHHVDAFDDRLVDRARQVLPDLGHRVLHIVQRPVGADLQPQLDQRGGGAVGHGGGDVLHAGHAGDRVLDLAGDLGLQLGRGSA